MSLLWLSVNCLLFTKWSQPTTFIGIESRLILKKKEIRLRGPTYRLNEEENHLKQSVFIQYWGAIEIVTSLLRMVIHNYKHILPLEK